MNEEKKTESCFTCFRLILFFHILNILHYTQEKQDHIYLHKILKAVEVPAVSVCWIVLQYYFLQ